MNSQISNQNCTYGNLDECECSRIEKPAVSLMVGKNNTPEEMCGASNNSLEADILELKIQLENLQETIEEIEKSHIHCYSNLTRHYDRLLLDYKQMENNMEEIKKDNNNLQNTKHSKNQKEVQMVKEIEELEFFLKKNTECNDILQDKIHKEKLCSELLEKQLYDLENEISCKTTEVKKSRCKLTEVERTICCENVKLQELQRRNAEYEKTIKELTSVYRELEVKSLELKETGPLKLTAANQSLEAARFDLGDACATAANWRAKCDNAEKEHQELQAAIFEETSQAQAELNHFCRERDRLTDQLSETSTRLSVARSESQKLLDRVRTKTNQLDVLKNEREQMKRRVNQNRSQQAVQQAKIEVETKIIEDQKILNQQSLVAINNEIDALKKAINLREEIIRNTMNELNGDCLTNRPIQRF